MYRTLVPTLIAIFCGISLATQQAKFSHLKSMLQSVDPVSPKPADTLPSENKLKKGRGKAKKTTLPRSSFTCLLDDTVIAELNRLAAEKDLPVSYFVRAALRHYLDSVVI